MIEGGLTDGRGIDLRQRQGDPQKPGDSQFRWGSVVRIGGSGADVPLPQSAGLIDTPILAVPAPLWVSLHFSADGQIWLPTPPNLTSTLDFKMQLGMDPLYGVRQDSFSIGALGGQNAFLPLWAKSSVFVCCKLSLAVQLAADLAGSSFSTWIAATCAPIDSVSGESLAAERVGSNIYGFPTTTSFAMQASGSATGPNFATLALPQKAWRQQFWIRNLPAAEQPAGVTPGPVYIGFNLQPHFDATNGVWVDYAIALQPGETYESWPVEGGSFWGNVYVTSNGIDEGSDEAPWVVASESFPTVGPLGV